MAPTFTQTSPGSKIPDDKRISHPDRILRCRLILQPSPNNTAIYIEYQITNLLHSLIDNGTAKFVLCDQLNWRNCQYRIDQDQDSDILRRHAGRERQVVYNRARSRHRFSLILYVLAEVHQLALVGGKSTFRELYYKDIALTRNQANVVSAVYDVCNLLRTHYWELGISPAGKGLVAGSLRMVMNNGEIIDCTSCERATLLPSNFIDVHYLDTTADFVLLVEKDTVFEKLLGEKFFDRIENEIILITGKGYPDMSTRCLVHRLCYECSLPIYVLVDADPFGIEILLVYRYGSNNMERLGVNPLTSTPIHWLGIHPSELVNMSIPTISLTRRDHKKLEDLLKRQNISGGVRQELGLLQLMGRKAEIENVSHLSLHFLINDYIPNKIKRNLLLI